MSGGVDIRTLLDRMDEFTRLHRKLNQMILDYYHLTESSVFLFDIIQDDQMTLKDITQASKLDKSTISRQVNNLVKKDLLKKLPGQDKRYAYFEMTKFAKDRYQSYQEEADRAFADLLSSWTEDEKQKLSILLMRLNRVYQSAI
ncbi:Predicted transcriptional regulator [Alloiococcus otitis]|uniref:HTH marR-type domain-containing protein n=1 Tax=Alloiococcus otitis ATCC 51267 TaxID=883081 RepID=K9EBG5_9LACT|nr:MarR family transcriptional regulator [Alloiococcus otitis]EKU94008.1 hypothetical protein HMPREF9698_00488 [Alloiococcus otitis ATCC 51267]SUU80907.1 Predicted transcriptional regulator [Alloiococcus otitis]